jgi:hypothetical protein
MTEGAASSNRNDLVDAVREVLRNSEEPLTIPKIRARLPGGFRAVTGAELTDIVQRQVTAHVLVICPKYRSGQDRFWDRSLRDHAKVALQAALADGPVSWPDLRKALPKYLRHLAESVLNEELARGAIHRHPPASVRQGPRYALQPAEVRRYVGKELQDLLARMQSLGFARAEAREAIVQILQAEEWAEADANGPAAAAAMPVRTGAWNPPLF